MNESKGNQAENYTLKEVPQINEITGISYDYRNEYVFLVGYFSMGGIDEVKAVIKKLNFVMKKYEERFSPSVYKNVINEKNTNLIRRINELVDSFNEKIKETDAFKEEDFLKIYKELEILIKG